MSIPNRLIKSQLTNNGQAVASYNRGGLNIGVEPIKEIVWLTKVGLLKDQEIKFTYLDSDLLVEQFQTATSNVSFHFRIVDLNNLDIFNQVLIAVPAQFVIPTFILVPAGYTCFITPTDNTERINLFGIQVSIYARELI